LSYDKVKHVVEVDENIWAVFVVDPGGDISHQFIAPDAKIDNSFIQTIRSTLDLRFELEKANLLGQHLWDIMEYDKVKVTKIYEKNRLIVILSRSHISPSDVVQTVLDYLYESDKQEPPCLF
jgi:hypothetical protein